ncbi:MAG: formylglycine-generating enzyme family protein [Candidatus Electrothrix sp. GW3-4]|uniref:formylglycine-generating enzyme family protein n=1 Tax=Candidatus Electrothrix sp. GW3-4 TaxID=3126740 RepID=UPI0030D4008F
MKHQGLCGRADLAEILGSQGLEAAQELAELLEYDWQAPQPEQTLLSQQERYSAPLSDSEDNQEVEFSKEPLADIPFWRPEEYEYLAEEKEETPPPSSTGSTGYQGWTQRPLQAPEQHLLAPWSELHPRLRSHLSALRTGHALDVDLAVRRICRGHFLAELPRQRRRRWGPHVQFIEDRSIRLVPLWQDQQYLRKKLIQTIAADRLSRAIWRDGRGLSVPQNRDDYRQGYCLPPPGSTVLIAGDLGASIQGKSSLWQWWLAFGREIQAAECRPLALCPLGRAHLPQELTSVWKIIPWTKISQSVDNREKHCERLLCLISPAIRIEPGLLRAVRRLLGRDADITTELDTWNHPAISSRSSAGASLHPEYTQKLRKAFISKEPEALRQQVLAILRQWRGYLPEEIWYEELLNLDRESLDGIPGQDRENARQYFQEFCAEIAAASGAEVAADQEWLKRIEARADQRLWADSRIGKQLVQTVYALHRHEPDYQPPEGFEPGMIDGGDAPLRKFIAVQAGGELQFVPHSLSRTGDGSPLALLSSRNGIVQYSFSEQKDVDGDSHDLVAGQSRIHHLQARDSGQQEHLSLPTTADQLRIQTDCEQLTLRRCTLPDFSWADAMGRDRFGLWAEFVVEGKDGPVRQRMRWIPPGRFLMGSPEDEPGRYDDEGPQHWVTINKGFWLFDTPVTQALWQAVTGENPSKFKSPDRPVEQVSWEDCQKFVQEINQQISRLNLSLPSEAQWEYACRAGSSTALYTGEIEIIGKRNAPALDDIAWYGGNSGRNFELDNGYDTSDWKEKQYDDKRAGTHPVGLKQANDWGLYDMLGNVWEWVADPWHEDYDGAPEDGKIWENDKPDENRVIRGGSWNNKARNCRSACRNRNEPDNRNDNIGFRCARAHERVG